MARQKQKEPITVGSVAKKVWSAVMFPFNFVATGVTYGVSIAADAWNKIEAFFVKSFTGARDLYFNPFVKAISDGIYKSYKKMLSLTFDIPVSIAEEINDKTGNIIAKNDPAKSKTSEYESSLSTKKLTKEELEKISKFTPNPVCSAMEHYNFLNKVRSR